MKTNILALIATASALALPLLADSSSATPATSGANLQYLSGTGPNDTVQWDFFCTAGNRSGEWTKIRVPSCWEQEGFGAYYYGNWNRNGGKPAPNIPSEQGKYRTTFSVPAAWKGMAVRIVFAGVMTDAEVLVNGKSAGPIHQGGFYQFEYDISALLNYGADNTLEANVSKESANISVNNAERRGDYWTFGGIYRPVWLEARPASYIERVAIDARADGTFTAEVFHGGARMAAGGTVSVQILDAKNTPVGEASAKFAAGETRTTIRAKISSPLPWTAETPNLYRAEFKYGTDIKAQIPSNFTQRFGFRTIEVRPGDGLYLNGRKIILKGINRHSFRPETGRTLSREQCYDDARLIKEMNMNAVRMSHYPPDSAFLEACDELGLYVLDELAGWQRSYDTPTGARLIGQMIRRDVNHPSIILWDNGNEGGWNTDNDGEFAKWDPQRRNVIHPWALHDNINTKHYLKYDVLKELGAGKDIFFPTEFLHGLYDGGMGAGLADYWRVMSASPVCAGGFFWAFFDEGVMRTDEHNRIDNAGNLAPDGIVGPHHEREGSFYTVKEIWSPVTLVSGPDKDGNVEIKNNYAFTDLKECKFEWYVLPVKKEPPTEAQIMSSTITPATTTKARAPLAPGAKGTINLGKFPADSIVCLRATDSVGHELWEWSWFTAPAANPKSSFERSDRLDIENPKSGKSTAPVLLPEVPQIAVHRGALQLRFDKNTGLLLDVRVAGKQVPITAGPTLTAYARNGRRYTNLLPPVNDPQAGRKTANAKVSASTAADGSVVIVAEYAAATEGRTASPKPPQNSQKTQKTQNSQESRTARKAVPAESVDSGTMKKIIWTIPPGDDAGIRLDYEYTYEGGADLLGVNFDVPEKTVLSKCWLGRGPYRVYRNRLGGGALGVHSLDYNDPLPGQIYEKGPEFKGYFRDWRWLKLATTGGSITLHNNTPPNAGLGNDGSPYIGLWRPRDGIPMMMEFPDTSLTLLDVIPAQGSKFDKGDGAGPQAATPKLSGKRGGSVTLHFAP